MENVKNIELVGTKPVCKQLLVILRVIVKLWLGRTQNTQVGVLCVFFFVVDKQTSLIKGLG